MGGGDAVAVDTVAVDAAAAAVDDDVAAVDDDVAAAVAAVVAVVEDAGNGLSALLLSDQAHHRNRH
jgi:hypothetical protein